MPDVTGMDLAAWVREQNPNADIIFVSNHSETVFEAIRYQPFRFIRKERLQEELPEALRCLQIRNQKKNKTIRLLVQRKQLILPVSDIAYVESRAHYLFFSYH